MPPPVVAPEASRRTLWQAIDTADLPAIDQVLDAAGLDANIALDDQSYSPLVLQALTAYHLTDAAQRLPVLQHLLARGADPNVRCKAGYNALHVAAQRHLAAELTLLLAHGGDVNLADDQGANVLYWLIQGFPWRSEGVERDAHLHVLEQALLLGAHLDQPNRFGATPRQWLERSPADVVALVARCEARQPVYRPVATVQPDFPTALHYPDVAKEIWRTLVPPQGPAATVQGELLRAIEKLRDEAQRNGNSNYNASHRALADFVARTLTTVALFDAADTARIVAATKRLRHARRPELSDEPYDYLTDQICRFYLAYPQPIAYRPA